MGRRPVLRFLAAWRMAALCPDSGSVGIRWNHLGMGPSKLNAPVRPPAEMSRPPAEMSSWLLGESGVQESTELKRVDWSFICKRSRGNG